MRRIRLAVFFVPILFFVVPTVRGGEKNADAPSVVVRFKSLDSLLQNVNLVVRLVGQEEVAAQIEGLVKSKIGKKGLEGIDPARPFGAYARFGKTYDEIHGAILIPMIDEKTFLKLLDNMSVNYKKDQDGVFTYKTDQNVNVYFRFANKYLYITGVNAESIKKKSLPDPAKALALSGEATISVVARIDQIPKDAKEIALSQLDKAIQAAKDKKQPGATKIQEAFRAALLDDFQRLASSVILDAAEVRFDLAINDKTKEMNLHFNVTPKPGSGLAKTIKSIGELKSPFAGIAGKNTAFHGGVHFSLPDPLNQAFIKVVEEAKNGALQSIQDDGKKAQAKLLFDALMPTASAGELNVAAAVLGPKQGHYTFIGAVKLKDGDKLGKTAHDLLADALRSIPADKRDKIKLNFDSVGAVKIHRFEVPRDDPKLDKILTGVAGDNQLYLAFRNDALFLALGKESLATLKTALAKTDSAASRPLLFDFDVARMANLMAQTQEQKDLAAKLFAKGENGRVRLTIDGGTSMSARLQMRLNVLEFLVKLKKEQDGN